MNLVCVLTLKIKINNEISYRMSKRPASGRAKRHEKVTNHVKCHLCSSDSPLNLYSRPSTGTEENRQWVNSLCTKPIPLDVSVCRACERFVKHHTGETGVVPRWVPKERCQKCCAVEGCGEISHTSTTITTYDIAQEHLDLIETEDIDSSPLALCNPHYQQLYRVLRFPLPCAACASQPRYGGDYTRRCPNPIQITTYLQQTVNFDGILSPDSKVCKPCYDFHRRVLQQQNAGQPTPVSTLHDIASRLEEKIVQFEASNTELITDKEYLGWVVCRVALQLVKTLQQDEAILLPEVHSNFCQLVSTSIENFPNVQKSLKTNPPTNRWLLSSISNHLHEHLGIVCKHKRYGTLLYRKNGDLLKSLSKALGNAQRLCKIATYSKHECSSVFSADLGKGKSTDITEDSILQACTALNVRMNQQIKNLVQTYQNDPILCESFDPDAMLQQLDPLLIQCIQILTKPVRERRQLFSQQDLHDSSGTLKSKSMKQLYCLCTLFFCTNSQRNMPLQYLLADAILCMGGSTELVKMLNRIGAVASLDTHDRMATLVVN